MYKLHSTKITLMNLKTIFYILILLFAYFAYDNYKLSSYKPNYSTSVDKEPVQTETYRSEIHRKDYVIKPLKNYHIQARVLSKKKYTRDDNSDISNFDLALGWKEMSDMNNLERIKISQGNRWYYWKTDEMFIPRSAIEHNSSNHHIIHANDEVYNVLKNIETHQIIEMKGFLVRVDYKNDSNRYWKSSLSRTDTGHGACELFYVEEIRIVE